MIEDIKSKCIDFDMPLDWGISRKKEYLSDCLVDLRDATKRSVLRLTNPTLNPTEREIVFQTMKDLKTRERMTEKHFNSLASKRSNNISDEMIEKAKQYPIEKLIEVKGYFAPCPFHHDRNPSFYVKNGFGYCFSCGESADAIKIAMKINQSSFIESVKYLTT